jgi:uncharacterized membrane protein
MSNCHFALQLLASCLHTVHPIVLYRVQALGYWMLWLTILTLTLPAIGSILAKTDGGAVVTGCGGAVVSGCTSVVISYIINWVRANSNNQTRPHHVNVYLASFVVYYSSIQCGSLARWHAVQVHRALRSHRRRLRRQ